MSPEWIFAISRGGVSSSRSCTIQSITLIISTLFNTGLVTYDLVFYNKFGGKNVKQTNLQLLKKIICNNILKSRISPWKYSHRSALTTML
jgi:predicted ATPase